MDKIKYWVIIRYLFLKDNTPTQTKEEMAAVYGDSAPTFTTVIFWAAEFKHCCTNLGGDKCSGWPKKNHNYWWKNKNYEHIQRICLLHLNRNLSMHKQAAHWLPHLLTLDQKHVWMNTCTALLVYFKFNKSKFFSLVNYCRWNLNSSLDSKDNNSVKTVNWKGRIGSKESKNYSICWKSVARVFWDNHGIILMHYLESGKTITWAYYATLLEKLQTQIVKKWPHLQKKKIFFHQDNTPSHTSAVAMVKIHELP